MKLTFNLNIRRKICGPLELNNYVYSINKILLLIINWIIICFELFSPSSSSFSVICVLLHIFVSQLFFHWEWKRWKWLQIKNIRTIRASEIPQTDNHRLYSHPCATFLVRLFFTASVFLLFFVEPRNLSWHRNTSTISHHDIRLKFCKFT